MRLNFVVALGFVLFASFATAQKKNTSKAKPVKVDVKANAAKIIQFGNTVIDMGNTYSETFNNYYSLLENVDKNKEWSSRNSNSPKEHIRCDISSIRPDQKTAYNNAIKYAPNFAEKSEIIALVKDAENSIQSINTWCATLSAYNENNEIATDKQFVKLKTIQDSMQFYVTKSSKLMGLASKKASEAGNKAELLLLADSPLASFVIPMKKDIMSIKNLFELFKAETPDDHSIQLALNEVKKSIEVNKDINSKDASKLRDVYYKEVYQNFYGNCEDVLKSLETVSKRLADQKIDKDNINSWFSSASGYYVSAIEEYNKFVSQ